MEGWESFLQALLLKASEASSEQEAIDLCSQFNMDVPIHHVIALLRLSYPDMEMDFSNATRVGKVLEEYASRLWLQRDEERDMEQGDSNEEEEDDDEEEEEDNKEGDEDEDVMIANFCEVIAFDGENGSRVWTRPIGITYSGPAVADLNGDGEYEVVVGGVEL